MTIFVDELKLYPKARHRQKFWCHLATDGDEEELHEFAARIGLKREWCQKADAPSAHYDLTPSVRVKAVKQGALPVSARELIGRCLG